MAGFADHVRIRSTDETERLGLAGREGQVFGWTTPSVTGVTVIGSPTEDYAINVNFDELKANHWFAEDLVEFIDNAAGTVISLDGQNAEWVRRDDGEREERSRSS